MPRKNRGNSAFGEVSRRRFIATLGAGAAISAIGITVGKSSTRRSVLRPPGAIEEGPFLSLCARCGRCVTVCPNSALRLQGLENGLDHLMTPKLVPGEGYCVMPLNGCQNCIEACPARVLQPLPIANLETGSLSKVVKMGTAILDTTTCIPYALKQPCLACKEICPVEGAITTHGGEGRGKGGRVRKPEFNHDVCVGCGACEYVCHAVVKADAVKVSTEGVKRTPWEG